MAWCFRCGRRITKSNKATEYGCRFCCEIYKDVEYKKKYGCGIMYW